MNTVQIIESHSEIGAGTRGASLGPYAIKVASLNSNSNYFVRYPPIKIADENHILYQPVDTPCAKRIAGIIKVYEHVANAVNKVLEDGKFPLLLAGDHSSAGGTIAGIKKRYPDKRLGIIWIDAHADLHSPYTSPSGNVHGMPLTACLGEDNEELKENEVSEKTLRLWNDLKNVTGINPKISYEDIVFIGVRDADDEERNLIRTNKVKLFSVTETRVKGFTETAQEAHEYLKNCDLIYVSFDVDSMDPFYVSHGTGTPVPVGFTKREIIRLLKPMLANEKICCFEITEVNPTLDEKKNLMAETAFEILELATEILESR